MSVPSIALKAVSSSLLKDELSIVIMRSHYLDYLLYQSDQDSLIFKSVHIIDGEVLFGPFTIILHSKYFVFVRSTRLNLRFRAN